MLEVFLFIYLFIFETGFLCIDLAVLELTVDQAGLKLRNPPASASQVLGLKACTTTTRHFTLFIVCVWVFETGFLCVALAVLELTL